NRKHQIFAALHRIFFNYMNTDSAVFALFAQFLKYSYTKEGLWRLAPSKYFPKNHSTKIYNLKVKASKRVSILQYHNHVNFIRRQMSCRYSIFLLAGFH